MVKKDRGDAPITKVKPGVFALREFPEDAVEAPESASAESDAPQTPEPDASTEEAQSSEDAAEAAPEGQHLVIVQLHIAGDQGVDVCPSGHGPGKLEGIGSFVVTIEAEAGQHQHIGFNAHIRSPKGPFQTAFIESIDNSARSSPFIPVMANCGTSVTRPTHAAGCPSNSPSNAP